MGTTLKAILGILAFILGVLGGAQSALDYLESKTMFLVSVVFCLAYLWVSFGLSFGLVLA